MPAPTNAAGEPIPVVMVGHTLEVASASVFTACRHKVEAVEGGATTGGGAGQRLSISLQVRARPDATIDQTRVPNGLRRATGLPRTMSVQQVQAAFEAGHGSVNGHGGGGGGGGGRGGGGGGAAAAAEEDDESERPPKRPRQSEDEDDPIITIRVRDPTGEETFFKVKRSTRFERVFSTYALRKGESVQSMRFLIDGNQICPSQTPAFWDMKDQDQIDMQIEQRGD